MSPFPRIPENTAMLDVKKKKVDLNRLECSSTNSSPQRNLSGGDDSESEEEGENVKPRGKELLGCNYSYPANVFKL